MAQADKAERSDGLRVRMEAAGFAVEVRHRAQRRVRHNERYRAIARNGDGFMAAFASARSEAEALIALARKLGVR